MLKPSLLEILLLATLMSTAHAESPSAAQAADAYRRKAYSARSISPIFSQLLAHAQPPGFKPVFEKTNGPHYIRESVLSGEDENNWSQMITVTGVRDLVSNPNASPRKFAEAMAAGFKRACPESFAASVLAEGKMGAYDAFSVLVSCGTSPTTGGKTSESALVTVIKGEKDYYTVQWAERAAPSTTPMAPNMAKWGERFRALSPIKLCRIVPGEAAPYPSCISGK